MSTCYSLLRYVKKIHADESIYKFFCYVWKERTHKLSEETAAKTFFAVSMLLIQLASMGFFVPNED